EALMTDIGVTGGGNGRHMIYSAGKQDHTIDGATMVDHIVQLVEAKAAALKAEAEAEREKLAAE
ncbi:MAG TPA: 4-hydroxy-3-methylbut-2-en-1-yl diphosphate synthase, partial [Rhodopila sp.]